MPVVNLNELMREITRELNKATESDEKTRSSPQTDIEARVLSDLLPLVTRQCPFKVGDLVVQRKEHGAYKIPTSVAIVTHLLDMPHLDPEAPAVEVRNDMMVLFRTERDDVVEIVVQSWRFDAYTGSIA